MEDLNQSYCDCGYELRDENDDKNYFKGLKLSQYLRSFFSRLTGIIVF